MAAEPRRRRLGIRARATIAGVAVTALVLLVASAALVVGLRRALTDDVRDLAFARAEEVAAEIDAGPTDLQGTVESADDDLLVQVVHGGDVVAAPARLDGLPPLADLEPGQSAEIDPPPGEDDPFLAVAVAAPSSSGTTVLAARNLDSVLESTSAVQAMLLIGVPLLLLVLGLAIWVVVGRALRPVEAIRHEVDEISLGALQRRVPHPGTNDEVGRLASTMNRMLDRLDRAAGRQRRFVADASHELRSPVASIRQQAEVALAHPDRTSVEELAAGVRAENLRLERLVDDLLLLARPDEQPRQLARRSVDVDDLVLDEARSMRATGRLQVDTSGVSAGQVLGDATLLQRAIRNLASNAERHAAGTVAFTVAEQDGAVVVQVDDDGAGVPPAERSRVFERFVRLDEARTRDAGGSGLGLAIVAEVVAAHGGSVVLGDSPLGGARATVRLPVS